MIEEIRQNTYLKEVKSRVLKREEFRLFQKQYECVHERWKNHEQSNPCKTMASFQPLTTLTTTITMPNSTTNRRSKTFPKPNHRFKVSCNAASDDNEKLLILPETQKLILPTTSSDTLNLDRRNLLLGLGGLYTSANFTSLPAAFAKPITTPGISTCVQSTTGFENPAVRTEACCPPSLSKTVKNFVFPKDQTIRIRRAAHRATPEYIAKYKAALQAMKDLPGDHPHSFVQQAKIHCAYCNGGYTQIASGFPDKELQIHNSWLFFPFHRWYLYFYERILGKLINDPTFALPYWNWDNPAGMTLPAFFEDEGKSNPAFDALRDVNHLPPAIVNLDYDGPESTPAPCVKQISINLKSIYRQLIRNGGDTLSFFGGVYRAGDDAKKNGDASVGSIEAGCHTAVHRWLGNPRMPNNEDMGNFYSAGYDPAFYVHHANVDRMWKLWKELGRNGHTEPDDPDWLNASYVFYDENQELVRVYNKDCVHLEKLKYAYDDIPWINQRPLPIPINRKSNFAAKTDTTVKKQVQEPKFPLTLDKITKVMVKRPVINRSQKDKDNANEVLFVQGIKYNGGKYVKFDVLVNDRDQDDVSTISADESEFAGSFAMLPHNHADSMLMTSAIRFGLTELLEDIGAEGDEFILVTLVPKVGCEEVTIGDIKVELVQLS